MELLNLFLVASMPVLKLLLLTALGSFLALDRIGILGDTARKNLNTIVFYVFSPAIVSSNLAKTVTLESITLVWFMPLNVMLAFLIGSALGWLLVLITRAPQHLKGIVFGSCTAGNLGMFPLIIFPALCKEKGSPFGDPNVCHTTAMSYASLSMAIGAIYIWSYVYNIVRVLSVKAEVCTTITDSSIAVKSTSGTTKLLLGNATDTSLLSKENATDKEYGITVSSTETTVALLDKMKQLCTKFYQKINVKAVIAPSTIGVAVGFFVGLVSPVRRLMIGASAPLRVIEDSAFLLGEATIPTMTLIVGGNLLKGLKGSGVPLVIIIGIIAVRYILLPLSGILIVKGAIRYGLVSSNPLYQFVLLVQYALPPAMNIGTITQLFGSGQNECSVILLWTYLVASVSLTMWSTVFMLLVA